MQLIEGSKKRGGKMPEKTVLYQIKSLEKMIARNLICNSENENSDISIEPAITPTQMQIIHYILEHLNQEVYQKDLEEILNLSRETVSGVLQTMEKNGLIVRITDNEDTRIKKIILNKNAKEIFLKNKQKIEELEKVILKDIAPKDMETFLDVINKMKENIKANKINKRKD